MIDRIWPGYELVCDVCDATADEQFDSFEDAVAFKRDRSNGWRSRNVDGVWEDLCPDCAGRK